MKYLGLVLAIYIFALNLAPCADYVASTTAINTEISQAVNDSHQHQDSDLCSPFCICQCCHISATALKFADLKLDVNIIYTQDFLYLNGNEKDFTISLFQPPKV